ncbi:MAG: Undecaprenyl-diphosphatase [Methanocella sp. PtaU1.Bin125]|nr:MAG: Undecaprenyl-diphosphatase [Methanocella sp. PtaU1.Bin125]
MMQDIDQAVQAAFNAHSVPGYSTFFYAVTQLGSAYLWIATLAIYLFVGRWKKIAAALIITLAFGMIVNEDIKGIVQRIRPENVMIGGYFTFYNFSFPSGHTETAFILATVMSAFIALRYSLVTYLLAVSVGISRIYLGVHYFTDIIGGALTGIAIGWLAALILFRTGMIRNNTVLSAICSALGIPAIDTLQRPDIIKALIAILFGLGTAMVLLLTGEYILSLATLSFLYIQIWTGLSEPGKAVMGE